MYNKEKIYDSEKDSLNMLLWYPKTPAEWGKIGYDFLFNGLLLAGGGLFVILAGRLLK
jgi:hypothetical protein